jgi:hypothetical protein
MISARSRSNQSINYAAKTHQKPKPVSLQSLLPNGGVNPVQPTYTSSSYIRTPQSQIINPTQNQLYLQLRNQSQTPTTNISYPQTTQSPFQNRFYSQTHSPQTSTITHSHLPQNSNLSYMNSLQFPSINPTNLSTTNSYTPQNLTMQQIIQYLFGSQGTDLSKYFQNQTSTFQTQCSAYCNALPSDPVCDSTNYLYRNECEAQCFQRTIVKSKLKYGMCCCDDSDFYTLNVSGVKIYQGTVGGNNSVCLPKCLYECLGEESGIDIDSGNSIIFTSSLSVSGTAPCNSP